MVIWLIIGFYLFKMLEYNPMLAYIEMVVAGIQTISWWWTCLSEPGVPSQIIKNAAKIEAAKKNSIKDAA